MRTTIGKYDYNRVEADRIIVTYNDGAETPTDRIVMIFVKSGDQLITQGNIYDADSIEMHQNAVKIFKGEITL